jgi:hypothetical protein
MPSSHSATVAALAMAVGFQEGFGGSLFSIALILACVVWFFFPIPLLYSFTHRGWILAYNVQGFWWQVMYDATGVRLQAGRQAEVWCFSILFSHLKCRLFVSLFRVFKQDFFSSGPESNPVWTPCWTSSFWQQTAAWTAWAHPASGLYDCIRQIPCHHLSDSFDVFMIYLRSS